MVPILRNCCKIRSSAKSLPISSYIKCQKFASTQKSSLRKTIYKREDVKNLRLNVIYRYMDYVRNYNKVIESKFPTALSVVRTFKCGLGEFYQDLKAYITVIRKLNKGGIRSLTVKETELYHVMPKDMMKMFPTLLFSAVPLAGNAVFPLVYYFPRHFLCKHFWTIQQRSEFTTHYFKQRLMNNRPTFRCMQAELKHMEKKKNPLREPWSKILALVGSGNQPQVCDILKCKKLFEGEPYSLVHMQPAHVKNLLRIHGMSTTIWLRRLRLLDRARLIRIMDEAISRQHGPRYLCQESLRFACHMRGLSHLNMSREHLENWLESWITISRECDDDSASLVLHCPILLGYNQPSNWRLIY